VVGPSGTRVEEDERAIPRRSISRGSLAQKTRMKYLITVLVGTAGIIATITTAVAQAHGAFIGRVPLKPYLYAYAVAGALLMFAVLSAINTSRLERKTAADDKHQQIRNRLAAVMKQWQEIYARLKLASDSNAYTELIRAANDWANDAVSLLKEAGHPTDAELLSQVGHVELPSEQLARCAHIPEWKRNEVARFLLYYQTLDQIRSNRRF
jgi:hypothetical protein